MMNRQDHPTLLVRADGDSIIGAGHVMRSLSIAQEWRDRGGRVEWAATSLSETLRARLYEEGIAAHFLDAIAGSDDDADHIVSLATRFGTDWILLDGYSFDFMYQRRVGIAARRLVIDDLALPGPMSCEILVNQAIGISEKEYSESRYVGQFLLGPRYFLLRREFRAAKLHPRRIDPVASTIFISFGGADPLNLTELTLNSITGITRCFQVLVAASSHLQTRKQIEVAAEASPHEVCLYWDTPDIPELMAQADVAVIAGGTTSWEAAYMGLPSLVMTLADNQYRHAQSLERYGACQRCNFSEDNSERRLAEVIGSLLSDHHRRQRYAEAGQRLVDGWGPARIVDACLAESSSG
jgi:UDP-2,4-diacetamido-2,4,6-trideoxy-beta-L-altropyranose hydrolase